MASMTVRIEEELSLNGRDFGTTRSLTITGINDLDTRIVTVNNTELDLIKFDDDEAAGQFHDDDVKYVRITHLSGAAGLQVRVVGNGEEYFVNLEVGNTFILNNALMDANMTATNPSITANGTVGISLAKIDKIMVKADDAVNITLEYVVATA